MPEMDLEVIAKIWHIFLYDWSPPLLVNHVKLGNTGKNQRLSGLQFKGELISKCSLLSLTTDCHEMLAVLVKPTILGNSICYWTRPITRQ